MQILKKRERSRKSELIEYWGQVLWSEPPIMAGVFCSRRQGCWNETGEDRKLRVCVVRVRKRKVLAGTTGLGAAGASNRGPPASGTGCDPSWVSCPQWKPLPPGRASFPVFSASLPVSPSSSSSPQGLALRHSPYSTVSIQLSNLGTLSGVPSTPFSSWWRQQLRAVVRR